MKKDDIEFLKNLREEMLTQDTCCQASPRFWVVMQTTREYGISEEYDFDGTVIVDDEGEACSNDIESMYEYMHDTLDIDCRLDEMVPEGKVILVDDDVHVLENEEDVIEWIKDNTGYDYLDLVTYKDKEVIVPDTLFLTKRECEEHIKANSYHYNKPHPYAMTAWRSPQVEKLFEILESTDWEKELND